jgi:hypothetical protein
MRYMLMMHAPRGRSGDYQVSRWSPEDLRAHIGFMHQLNRELTDAGELVVAEGLTAPGEARVVRSDPDGLPAVTDGPYPESKEFLAGYWMVDVERPERAYEIAARASSAPGPGGAPMRIPIEVRRVMSAPSQEPTRVGAPGTRYMLLMHVPRETVGYAGDGWAPADWQAHLDYWGQLNRDLAAAGEMVTVQALTAPSEAKLVRVGTDGAPVTDGPFPESKEFLAGFWIVQVPDVARAHAIAARASAAPGAGGVPLSMPIEVRAVGAAPEV